MSTRIFKTRLQVRGYELDGYGHVNHSVYLNYFEFARWCMIEESGAGQDYFKRNGLAPVIARAEIEYKLPCFLAEWLIVETELIELRKRVAVFRQRACKEGGMKLAVEGRMTLVGVGAGGRAGTLPPDFAACFGGGA